MFKIQKKSGFSLVEIVIAAMIFLFATAGLLASFTQNRTTSKGSERRVQAAYVGREVLESLRSKVDQRDWAATNSLLAPGSVHVYQSGEFTATYTVEGIEVGGIENAIRKVTLNVAWPD